MRLQAKRADLTAGERRRDCCLVDVGRLSRGIGQVEVDLVSSGRGGVDDDVQLEVAELRGRRIRAARCDLGSCRGLRHEHGRHTHDRHHQRELCSGYAKEACPLRCRGKPLTQTRNSAAVVVEPEREQRQDERDLDEQELAVGGLPQSAERANLQVAADRAARDQPRDCDDGQPREPRHGATASSHRSVPAQTRASTSAVRPPTQTEAAVTCATSATNAIAPDTLACPDRDGVKSSSAAGTSASTGTRLLQASSSAHATASAAWRSQTVPNRVSRTADTTSRWSASRRPKPPAAAP